MGRLVQCLIVEGESEAWVFAGRLLKTRPAVVAGRALFAAAARQAREPALYARLGAPDTVAGRFELFTLHVALLILRLKGRGEQAQETSQALFDAYVSNMDVGLRELGVGDLSMGKKMKKLGQSFYGRLQAYETQMDDAAQAKALLERTVLDDEQTDAGPLARYALAVRERLAAMDDDSLYRGEVVWPEVAT